MSKLTKVQDQVNRTFAGMVKKPSSKDAIDIATYYAVDNAQRVILDEFRTTLESFQKTAVPPTILKKMEKLTLEELFKLGVKTGALALTHRAGAQLANVLEGLKTEMPQSLADELREAEMDEMLDLEQEEEEAEDESMEELLADEQAFVARFGQGAYNLLSGRTKV